MLDFGGTFFNIFYNSLLGLFSDIGLFLNSSNLIAEINS